MDIQKTALRLPRELHTNIVKAAESNGRTMNAEIVHRLETTFVSEIDKKHGVLTAEMARRIASNARANILSNAKEFAHQEIARIVCIGLSHLALDIKSIAGIPEDHYLEDEAGDPIFDELVNPLICHLQELGFEVEFTMDKLIVRF